MDNLRTPPRRLEDYVAGDVRSVCNTAALNADAIHEVHGNRTIGDRDRALSR